LIPEAIKAMRFEKLTAPKIGRTFNSYHIYNLSKVTTKVLHIFNDNFKVVIKKGLVKNQPFQN